MYLASPEQIPRVAEPRKPRSQPTLGRRCQGDTFRAPKKAEKPWSRWHARDLLERAEKLAGVPKIKGGLWHPYRRKWATERKGHPDTDVAETGGWKDLRSLQTAYQQPDEETMLDVMSETWKLREVR